MKTPKIERPYEMIGRVFRTLINPMYFDPDEKITKNSHLSVVIDKDGEKIEKTLMIKIDQLKDVGVEDKISDALYELGKSYGFICEYMIAVARITPDKIIDPPPYESSNT